MYTPTFTAVTSYTGLQIGVKRVREKRVQETYGTETNSTETNSTTNRLHQQLPQVSEEEIDFLCGLSATPTQGPSATTTLSPLVNTTTTTITTAPTNASALTMPTTSVVAAGTNKTPQTPEKNFGPFSPTPLVAATEAEDETKPDFTEQVQLEKQKLIQLGFV